MNLREQINESLAQIGRLEAAVLEEEQKLLLLLESCKHQRTQPAEIVFMLGEMGEIRHPAIKCLDCDRLWPNRRKKKK